MFHSLLLIFAIVFLPPIGPADEINEDPAPETVLQDALNQQPAPVTLPINPFWEQEGILEGVWSRYGPGPSYGTIAYREEVGDFPADWRNQYDGVISEIPCTHIGQPAWIKIGDENHWHKVIVGDCTGHAETMVWAAEYHILGELFWDLAEAHDFTHIGGVPGLMTFECPLTESEC